MVTESAVLVHRTQSIEKSRFHGDPRSTRKTSAIQNHWRIQHLKGGGLGSLHRGLSTSGSRRQASDGVKGEVPAKQGSEAGYQKLKKTFSI